MEESKLRRINRLSEWLCWLFGFINYQNFKGIYKSTQNSDYMFEEPKFGFFNFQDSRLSINLHRIDLLTFDGSEYDLIKCTNLQWFGACFWFNKHMSCLKYTNLLVNKFFDWDKFLFWSIIGLCNSFPVFRSECSSITRSKSHRTASQWQKSFRMARDTPNQIYPVKIIHQGILTCWLSNVLKRIVKLKSSAAEMGQANW